MGILRIGTYWYKAAFWSSVTVAMAAASVAFLLLLRHGLLVEWVRRYRKRALQLGLFALILAAGISLTSRAEEEPGRVTETEPEEPGRVTETEPEEPALPADTGPEEPELPAQTGSEEPALPADTGTEEADLHLEIEMEAGRQDADGTRYYRADNAGIRVRIHIGPVPSDMETDSGEVPEDAETVSPEGAETGSPEDAETVPPEGAETVPAVSLRSYSISVQGENGSLGKAAAEDELQDITDVEWSADPEEVAALGEGRIFIRVEAESTAGDRMAAEDTFILDMTGPEAVISYESAEPFCLYPAKRRAYCRGDITVSLAVSSDEAEENGGEAAQEDCTWTVFSKTAGNPEVIPEGESYTLAEDDEIRFAVSGTDLAGNPAFIREEWLGETQLFGEEASEEGEDCLYTLVRDTEPPVLYCSQGAAPVFPFSTDEEKDEVYYSALPEAYADGSPSLSVRLTVADANQDPGRLALGYLYVPAGQEESAAEVYLQDPERNHGADPDDPERNAGTDAEWQEEDAEWPAEGAERSSVEIELIPGTDSAPDGVYRFLAQGTDCAGNPLCPASAEKEGRFLPMYVDGTSPGRYVSGRKIIDTRAPEGVLSIVPAGEGEAFPCYRAELGAEAPQTDWEIFEPYRNETAADLKLETSDASPVRIMLALHSTSEEGIAGVTIPEGFEYECAASAHLRGEQIFYAEQVVLTDRAGNRSEVLARTAEICLDAGLPEVDLEAPSVRVRAVSGITSRAAHGQPLYGGPVRILVYVSDAGEGISSAGLREVVYDLKTDGEYLIRGKELFTHPFVSSPEKIGEGLVCSFSDTVLVPAQEETQSNDLELIVRARDRAGNEADQGQGGYFHFGIDTAAPSVSVRYDNNNAVNGHYFAAPRTAVIEVFERNLDPAKLPVIAEGGVVSPWQRENGETENGDRDRWRCEVSFAKDADCTLQVEGTDAVGNKAQVSWEGVSAQAFTVDMTPPLIEAVLDRSDVRNGRFYNHPKTAYLQIREHNFDSSLLRTSPFAEGLYSDGDLHTAVCSFTEEGEYRLTASCTDLAGNEAVPWSSETFVIDMTPPLAEIGGNAPATVHAGSGEWRPLIRMEDRWLESTLPPVLRGSGGQAGVPILWEKSEGETQAVYRLRSFPGTKAGDGIWILRCCAQDLAGNRTERSARYCINRYGSDFRFSGDTAAAAESGYLRLGLPVVVTEENVCPVLRRRITIYREGSAQVLEEGEAYEIKSSSAGGKNRTDCCIDASCFEKQGLYRIVVQSEDSAGNRNNSAAVRELAFRVDTEAPVCRIAGADPKRHFYRTSALPVRVLCADDAELRRVRILIRDEEGRITAEKRYGGEDVPREGIPVLIPAAKGVQTLEAEACDGAGNTACAEYRVCVMGYSFRQGASEEERDRAEPVRGVLPGVLPCALLLLLLLAALRKAS